METEIQATVMVFLPALSFGGMSACFLTCKNQEEKKKSKAGKQRAKTKKNKKKHKRRKQILIGMKVLPEIIS